MILIVLAILCMNVHGQDLEGASAQGSASTKSDVFSNVTGGSMTLDVTGINHVMIVCSFQVRMTAPESSEREGSFRIVDGADPENINSGVIRRSLSNAKSTDYGIGSLVHIFDVSAYSGNRTYSFQHSFNTVSRTLYTDVDMVGLKLKCGENHMQNAEAQMSSPLVMTDSWVGISAMETPVISTSIWGGFYVAASVEGLTTSFNTTSTADWKLQYKKGIGGSWTDMGPVVSRSMSNATDIGIVSLVGVLPNNSSPGDYYFRVAHKRTSSTSTVQTCSGNIVSVFLGAGDTYFEVFGEQVPSVQTSSSDFSDVISASVTPETTGTNIFMHAQYSMTCNAETNAPRFDLQVDNSIYDGYDMYRYISAAGEDGSGVNIGLAEGLSAGTTYNVSLRHASASGNTLTTSGLFLGGFYLSGKVNTLPVELMSFEAIPTDNSMVELEWKTSCEVNNDYFTLFRSKDGLLWDQVVCIDGGGNSNCLAHYEFKDTRAPKGLVYYRLEQTDFDGAKKIIGMTSCETAPQAVMGLNIFPNPAVDHIYLSGISYVDEGVKVYIYDCSGKPLIIQDVESGFIDLSSLKPGKYFVQLKGFLSVPFIIQ